MIKASLPKGTRDFSPEVLKRRTKIIDLIKEVYARYGFEPLETPAIENLSTLTGNYGEEGDKLLFKILNSGNYLSNVDSKQLASAMDNPSGLLPFIAEKGLRYDLTIPFARFVVQNRHALQLPFKRYQIQPVWRADRPQKGRYREFWQCDADVIGTKSLLCEADFIKIYHEVFTSLNLNNYEIKLNHRKILEAIAQTVGLEARLTDLTITIDKLDKIGWDEVTKELISKGIKSEQVEALKGLLIKTPLSASAIEELEAGLTPGDKTSEGISDLKEILDFLEGSIDDIHLQLDLSLARGLNYYTGSVFEVTIKDVKVGSVSGGGRYDNLTGDFGMPDVSGVGISFGVDRLYDVLYNDRQAQDDKNPSAKILLCHFDEKTRKRCVSVADQLRKSGISTEIYPDIKNLRKQLDYANKRGYKLTGVIGEEELQNDLIQVKNMSSGDQEQVTVGQLIERLK